MKNNSFGRRLFSLFNLGVFYALITCSGNYHSTQIQIAMKRTFIIEGF